MLTKTHTHWYTLKKKERKKKKRKEGKRRMYVDMDLCGDRCQLDKHIWIKCKYTEIP